jgi:hypothetical protein
MLGFRLCPTNLPSGGSLRVESGIRRLLIGEPITRSLLLLLKKGKGVLAGKTAHLLQPFHGHQSRERLAFALNDEFFMP